MFDWIFAFFHLFLLIAVIGYAFFWLIKGNVIRFVLIGALLTVYYFLVLHKAVKKEIARKKKK